MTWYLSGTSMCNVGELACFERAQKMCSPHCQIAFIKPSTNSEDKPETPYLTILIDLLKY